MMHVQHKRATSLHDKVICQLQRSHNQQVALRAMDEEQRDRVFHGKQLQLLREVERRSNQRLAVRLLSKEQEERVHDASLRHLFETINGLSTLHEELIREKNRQAVKRQTLEEQERRCTANALKQVLVQLERSNNQRFVARAMDDERHFRVAYDRRLLLLEEFEQRQQAKLAKHAMDMEQKRRSSQFTSLLDALNHIHASTTIHHVHAEIERVHNQKRALRDMELERQYRVQRDASLAVVREMEKLNNIRRVTEQADREQAFRSWRYKSRDTLVQLERRANQKAVTQLLDQEQQRRAGAAPVTPTDKETVLRENLHLDIQRTYCQRQVHQDVELERARRVTRERVRDISNEIVRLINQRRADQAMDAERQSRVASSTFSRTLDEMQLRVIHREISSAVEHERQRRMNHQLLQMKETTERLRRIHFQLAKRTLFKRIKTDIHGELAKRQQRLFKTVALEQLQRSSNQRKAREMFELERAQQNTRHSFEPVLRQLERRAVLEWVARETRVECNRRNLTLFKFGCTPRKDAVDASQLVQLEAIHDHLRRTSNVARVRQLAEEERSRRVNADNLQVVFHELERQANRRAARLAMKHAQQLQVTEYRKTQMLEDLLRKHQHRVLYGDMDEVTRFYEQAFHAMWDTPFKSAAEETRASTLQELSRMHNVKAVATAMEHERQRRITTIRKHTYMVELERNANQARAIKMLEHEYARRIHLERTKAVCEQIASQQLRAMVVQLAEQERVRRLSFRSNMRWKVNNHPIFRVQEQLLRTLNIARVTRAAENEQARRVGVAEFSSKVLCDLLREQGRRNARSAVDLEQAQRSLRWNSDVLLLELQHTVAGTRIRIELEREQNRRQLNPNESLRVMKLHEHLKSTGVFKELASEYEVRQMLNPATRLDTVHEEGEDFASAFLEEHREGGTLSPEDWVVLED